MFVKIVRIVCVLLMLSAGVVFYLFAMDSVEVTVSAGGDNAVLGQILTLCTWCVSCAIVFGAALVALALSKEKAANTTDD